MLKSALKVITITTFMTYFLIPNASAVSFMGFGTNNNAPAPAAAPASKNMTPEQFRSTVNSLNQQSQADFSKQLKQDMDNAPPPPVIKPGSTTATQSPGSSTSMPSTTTNTAKPNTPAIPTGSTAPSMSGSAPTMNTINPNTPPPNYGSQAPQTGTYTGFGSQPSQSPNQLNTTPSSSGGGGNSGGWNIKY